MKLFVLLFAILSAHLAGQPAIASEPADLPSNACIEGCNDFMKKVYDDFNLVGQVPDSEPAVYSGECHHLSRDYDSDFTHYGVVMLDQKTSGWNFSTIFSFFTATNEFSNWNVDLARKQMSPYWLDHGDVKMVSNAARVVVRYENGDPAYIYWMRQNLQTKELLYITYAGGTMTSFCRLGKN